LSFSNLNPPPNFGGLILEILNVFLWLISLKLDAFLELEPRLNMKTNLTGQVKIGILKRLTDYLLLFR